MSLIAGRLLSGLTRGISTRTVSSVSESVGRTSGIRCMCLSSRRPARSKRPDDDDDEVVNNEPIKFSTSKASHRTWKVDQGMGRKFERPWWKVLPLSLSLVAFLLWCAFREETDIDAQLERQLYERLPGLLEQEEDEEEEDGNK